MRKLFLFLLLALWTFASTAQLSGTYTVGAGGDYGTIAAAITDLNTQGVAAPGVTFNVAAGHTESTTATLVVTATGTATAPIVFQKSGAGANPLITRTDAGTVGTTTLGADGDAIIRLNGTDYFTFDGIDLTANDQGIEYGFYTFKTATDASHFVTVKNCSITMTKGTSGYVMGIYISNGPASTSSATGVTVTDEGGRNKNITITGNTIQNVHAGVYVRGSIATGLRDTDVIVGEAGNGNTIQNFGGGHVSTTYGVYFIYVDNPSVVGNTITSATHGSTLYGVFYSVVGGNVTGSRNDFLLANSAASSATYFLYNGNAATTEEYNNNTFAAGTLSSTGSFYLIYATNATPNKSIVGNAIVGTINRTGTSGTFYAYSNTGSPASGTETIMDNNFSNVTVAGTSSKYGIYSNTAVGQNRVCSGNLISNWSGGTGATYPLYVLSSLSNQVYDNNVYDISGGGAIWGLYFTGTNPVVYNNRVYNLTTTGTTIYGIYNAGTGTTHCYGNQVYNLTANNASATLYGIYATTGTANYTYNNFISDLKTPTSGSTTGLAGIYVSGGTSHGLFYNTIYLNATSSGTNFGSSGIYCSTTPTVEIRNNIVVNNSTPAGTGFTIAYRRSTTTLTSYAAGSNNNDWYAGTPGAANLIFYDGTNADQTLADFKGRVSPRDGGSFTEMPPFVNSTTTPFNLHLLTTVPTQCEGGGTPVTTPAITTDFDGDTRNATTPDVGADEGNFTPLDLTGPAIVYTPLNNTSLTTSRSIVANITDASGVPATSPGWPTLYYQVNAGGYIAVSPTTVAGADFTFVFGGGVVTGDVVDYYVAAQDNAGNVSVMPGGGAAGFTINPPAASTPPTTPNSYTIVNALSGTVTVGTGGDYPSLTAAGGLFEAINNNVLTGNVVANVTTDLAEDGTHALNQWAEDGVGDYTLLIQPGDAINKNISGSYSGGLVRLNGADRVTFDGSFSGSGRYLSISNTATTASSAALQLISLGSGAGCENVTISNCNIAAGSNTVVTYGIYVAGSAAISTSNLGADNNTLTIENNAISKAQYGIYARGVATTGELLGLNILNNTIGSNNASDYITAYGAYLSGMNGANIIGNEIFNMIYNGSKYGIYFVANVSNTTLSKNKVHTFDQTNTSAYYATGIYFSSSVGCSNNQIDNNMIYGLMYYGSTSNFYNIGIRIVGGTNYKLYFNSISMAGSYTNATSGLYSQCVYVSTASTNMDVRNNILSNTRTGTNPRAYTFHAVTGTTFSQIDYNDYYSTGAAIGFLGSEIVDFTAWQAATGQDLNSIAADPKFLSNSNLHIMLGAGSPVGNAGITIAGITDDIDGDLRNNPPDMGADEFDDVSFDTDLGATALVAPATGGCYGSSERVTVTIKNYGTADIDFAVDNATVTTNVTGAVTQTLSANLTSGVLLAGATQDVMMSTTLDMTTPGTYTFDAFTTIAGDANAMNDAMPPATRTVVAPAPVPFIENFNASTTPPAGWTTTGWTIAAGGHGTDASNGLYKNIWSSAPSGLFTLPKVGIIGATDEFSFNYRIINYSSYPATATPNTPAWGTILIEVSNDCGGSFSTFATIDATTHISTTDWAAMSYPLAAYVGNELIFRFTATWAAGDYYIDFDNFEIQEPPSCLTPTALMAALGTPASTQAILSWTENGTATAWEIEYGTTGFTPGSGTTVPTTTNPHTLSGLLPATTYDFYVRADCGSGSYSNWAGPKAFTTECLTFATPFEETFQATTIPNCWSMAGPQAWLFTTTWPGWGATGVTDHTGTGGSFAGVDGSGSTGLTGITLYTPFMDITTLTAPSLRFYLFNNNTNTPTVLADEQKLVVGFWDGAAWNNIYTWDYGQNSATWVEVIVGLGAFTITGDVQFRFVVDKGTGSPFYDDLIIDDVNVENIAGCPTPGSLAAAPGTPPTTQAILSWTENGTATTWELEWGPAGFTPGTGTTVVTTTNPHTLNGLTASQSYDFYVRSDCNGSYSNWAGPKTFQTACEVTIAPFTENFELTTFPPVCWENVAVSGTFLWTRSTAASGYGSGTASAYANFYSQSTGSTYELITNQFDASSMTNPTLKFDYAYATYAGEVDQMDVYTSTNGGASWNLLLAMPGGTAGILNTGGTTTSGFVPTAGQWGTQNLALPAGTNKVKFQAISAYGNNLYLDNISVYQPVAHDVAVMSIDLSSTLFNQPVTPQVTVINNGTNTETFDVNLTATGGYSSTVQVVALGPGLTTQVTFASWNPGPGTYTLNACTQLVGDLVPANDCAQKQVQVSAWFAGMNMPTTSYVGTAVGFTDNSVTPPVGYLFAIGGNTASNLGTECNKYNTMTDLWSPIASLPAGRRVLASAIVGKNIYAIGGSDMASVYQNTVYKYDIDLDAWTTVAPFPVAAAWLKAVAVGNNIYVAGGVDAASTVLSSVYVYNTVTDVWATATSMPGPLFGGAFSATGNTLVYVGGADLAVISDVVYVGTIDAGNPAVISWLTKSPFPGSNGKGVLAYKIDPAGQIATYIKEDNSNADPYPGGTMYRFDGAPWGPDGIIVAGGSPTAAWVPADPNPCYVYIPSTDTWIQKDNVPVPVLGSYLGSSDVYTGGTHSWKLVVASGLGSGGPTPVTQVLAEDFNSMVTFNVDVSTISGFDHATEFIYIAGNFPGASWNEPGTNPNLLLSRVGVTDIYTITLDLPDGAYQYKYFRNATWNFGEWSGGPNRNIAVSGNTVTEDVFGGDITWANLQWPANGSVAEGGNFNVYGQAFIPNGITGAAGATFGLEAWVGIHTADTDPSGWTTWVATTFNSQAGDNDEFTADIAAGLTPGTYYYAFRYRFGQTYGEYLYGGFNGGFWDGVTNVSGELTITPAVTNKSLDVTVFLEGPFNGTDMDTDLNTAALIPLAQPYNTAPWNYTGTETVATIPVGVVDWVLVEFRDADNSANADETTTFLKKAYFLRSDGQIVDLDGVSLPDIGNPVLTDDLYVVVRHRNHIDVLSNTAVPLVGNAYTYDFSTALTQAYGAGAGYKLLGGTVYGMVSGDADADGKVFATDFVEWATESGNLGVYTPADMDFDGNVFASDAVLWAGNSGMDNPIEGGLSTVPVYTSQVPGDK